MHVSSAKHSYVWLPRKCDYRTDTGTDRRTDICRTKWSLYGEMHVSPAKHSYVWLPRKCDYRTDTRTDGRTDTCRTKWSLWGGMHVSPAKHSYVCLPRKCDYRTDTHMDRHMPDKVIPMWRYASQATQKQLDYYQIFSIPWYNPSRSDVWQ